MYGKVKTMATINFLYRSTKDESYLTLRLLHRHGNKDFVFSSRIKYRVEKEYWKLHNTKSRTPQIINKQIKVNEDLKAIRNHILEEFDLSWSVDLISNDWLKSKISNFYNPESDNKTETNVLYWINHIIENSHKIRNAKGGKGLSYNRLKAYKSLGTKFKEYQNRTQLRVEDLTKKEFYKFYDWLFDVQDYSDSTATKLSTDLQAVVRYAKLKEIKIANDFDLVKFDKVKTYDDDMDVITLSITDIEKIESLELTNESLINARKWLILGCFTGQRGTDLTTRVIAENFIDTQKGLMISIKQTKGNKKVLIPVLPRVKEILEIGLPYKISTQQLNKKIKIVCNKAEVKEMVMGKKVDSVTKRNVKKLRPKYEYIGTHTGRRTFATLHYNKIPLGDIRRVTGHSSEATLMIYINQSDDQHVDVFNDYYRLLEDKKQATLDNDDIYMEKLIQAQVGIKEV